MSTRVIRFSGLDRWEITPHASLDQPTALIFDQPPARIDMVQEAEPGQRSSAYLEAREEVWQEKKKAYGDKLWNGRVCAVRRLSVEGAVVVVGLSACEYKDILFKKQLGLREFGRRFPGELVDIHAFTAALPITDDGHAVFGVVGRGTVQSEGQLDLIGGTLNIDERPISSFRDVQRVTAEEFEEEAGTGVPEGDWEPLSINFHGGCCFFLLRARVERERVISRFSRNEELAALVSCSYARLSDLGANVTEDLAFMLTYAAELEGLFKRGQDADPRHTSNPTR